MFIIFADAHKIIAGEIYNSILNIYGIELDKKSLLWGSVLPDISPKYKLIRHYKDESIDYISSEIVKVIYINRNLDIDSNKLAIKILSKKLGIISHYLSDYTCLPHAERWTFQTNMLKHIRYEAELNEFVKTYKFNNNRIKTVDLDPYEMDRKKLKEAVKAYINTVVDMEYIKERNFNNDMDFAISLNQKISYFILETISVYREEFERGLSLQF